MPDSVTTTQIKTTTTIIFTADEIEEILIKHSKLKGGVEVDFDISGNTVCGATVRVVTEEYY